eukprot:TRINITY_DN2910_c0_g6_i1.p4 TRINITY_DN2910_c0_g6~~TRINITY_DN2910_c0_g6_i1.p4  ORF type:complete len:116 (+),score=13.40 TRINITY_DN2910_c0_g6_i1:1008-1355(+)
MASYLAKLKDPQWEFPAGFSTLAKDLFLRLVKIDPNERYTAKEALLHPWITRCAGEIPLNYYESVAYEQGKKDLINVRCWYTLRHLRYAFLLVKWEETLLRFLTSTLKHLTAILI